MVIFYFFDGSLFETMQTLFWTVFGVIDMNQFNLSHIESFTKFSAKIILGTYAVITNVVLLNLLIAMLNNSYQLISVSIWNFVIETSELIGVTVTVFQVIREAGTDK